MTYSADLPYDTEMLQGKFASLALMASGVAERPKSGWETEWKAIKLNASNRTAVQAPAPESSDGAAEGGDEEDAEDPLKHVTVMDDVRAALSHRFVVIGATVWRIFRDLDSTALLREAFDLVIIDEASQLQVRQGGHSLAPSRKISW
jgi:hypothetical protein